ncbi:hypothetical protein ACFL3E_01220 [Patescibacteria group bacterium]
MAKVHFITKSAREGGPFSVREENYKTKKAAIEAIRVSGAKPGKKLLDGTRTALIGFSDKSN